MILNVDEYNSVTIMLAGLFQFGENELFSQAELALTDNEVLIYDDHAPDEVKNDTAHYRIKKRVPLENITVVLNEKIVNNKDMAYLGRLVFAHEEEEQSFIFYYFVNDKKEVAAFCKALGALRIKVKKIKIDLCRENL